MYCFGDMWREALLCSANGFVKLLEAHSGRVLKQFLFFQKARKSEFYIYSLLIVVIVQFSVNSFTASSKDELLEGIYEKTSDTYFQWGFCLAETQIAVVMWDVAVA